MTAEKRFGLYSAFLACKAICFRSNFTPKFTVDTTFCSSGTIPDVLEDGTAVAVAVGATAEEPAVDTRFDIVLFACSSADAEDDDALLLLFPFCADIIVACELYL